MQTPQTEIYHETVVLPLFEIVIFPDSRTKFNVSKATGELLLATLKNGGAARAVGLTVKSGTRLSEVTTESMYRTGNLFRIPRVEPADDGYLVCAQVVKRVRATVVTEKDGQFYATFEPVPDILDIEPDLKGPDHRGYKTHHPRDQQPVLRLGAVHQADRPDGLG